MLNKLFMVVALVLIAISCRALKVREARQMSNYSEYYGKYYDEDIFMSDIAFDFMDGKITVDEFKQLNN